MADLDQQIAQVQARLRGLQAKAIKQKRSDDTRRKILYGSAILKHLENAGEKQQFKTLSWLHEKITRGSDREFLGLTKLSAKDGDATKG